MRTDDSSTNKAKSLLRLVTVKALIEEQIIEPPLDGNHGEIHPTAEDYVTEGIPFIMASDLSDGVIDLEGCYFITERQALMLRKGFAKKGDVLLSHKATIGRTAIVGDIPHKFIMLTPQVTYYRVKDEEKLNREYLKYYFDCDFFQKTISQWAGAGSTRAYIGIIAQQQLPVILPPIKVQKKIASILSAYDDLIESNKRRIAILEKMAEEIYREWFVRMRFPGHKEAIIKDGLPDGWRYSKFSDEISNRNGFAFKSEDYTTTGHRIIRTTDFALTRYIDLNDSVFISEAQASNFEGFKLEYLDYLMVMVGASLGKYGVVHRKDLPALQNQNMWAFRPKASSSLSKYYLLFLMPRLTEEVIRSATGAARDFFRKEHFNNKLVLVPSKAVLDSFNKLVGPQVELIDNLITANKKLELSRDLLLPRLISGKLSVENLELPSNESASYISNALPQAELAHA